MEFYDTVGGRRFVESTVPRLADAVERLAAALEKANALMERELALAEAAETEVKAEDAVGRES